MNVKRMFRVCLTVMVVWTVVAPEAHAYVDPGSGTLLWQLLLASLFGALFWVHRLRLWLVSLVTRLTTKRKSIQKPE